MFSKGLRKPFHTLHNVLMDGQVIKHGESKAELKTSDPGFTGVNTSKEAVQEVWISHLAGSSG